MRMQVILDSSFARPGLAPIWGGKKGEFRDWTILWLVCFCYFIQVLLSGVSSAIGSCLLTQGNISRLALCLVRIALKLARFRKPTFIGLTSGAGRTTCISQLSQEYLTSSHKFSQVLISSYKSIFIGLNYRCEITPQTERVIVLSKLLVLKKSLLSISHQHGNNNQTISVKDRLSQQFRQSQGCFFTYARAILEYDAYDVLLKCVLLANTERRCWTLQVVE